MPFKSRSSGAVKVGGKGRPVAPTGGQTLSGALTEAVAAGFVVSYPSEPPAELTLSAASDEGYAISPLNQAWQSAFTTKAGVIIDRGEGAHGIQDDNSHRIFDPSLAYGSRSYYARTRSTYGAPPSNYPVGGRPWTQYDNVHYLYCPRLDLLGIPTSLYSPTEDSFPFAYRNEDQSAALINVTSGLSTSGDGLYLGWSNDEGVTPGYSPIGTHAGAIIAGWNGSVLTEGPAVFPYGNPAQAWSSMLDAGVAIGGVPGGGDSNPAPYMWFYAPAKNYGVTSKEYLFYQKTLPALVEGAQPYKVKTRDACCFVGEYVYWVGGSTLGNVGGVWIWDAHFFRMKVTPHLYSGNWNQSVADPMFSSGEGAIERLPDCPVSVELGLLRHDPHANALLLFGRGGTFIFDLRTLTWSADVTPSAYLATYSGKGALPFACVGDYIDTQPSGQVFRKFYWRAGLSIDAATADNKKKWWSAKLQRPADDVSYLNVEARNPENDSATWGAAGGGPFVAGMKHQKIFEKDGYLYLMGGDWSDGYPLSLESPPSGYKTEPINSATLDNCRQEIWRCSVADAVSTGTATWRMVGNAYAHYPYVSALGRGYYNSFERGPMMPDGLQAFVDNSGQIWQGPCDDYYDYLYGLEISGQRNTYAPMFKWLTPEQRVALGQPVTNVVATTGAGINGVALGNGYSLPNQDRIMRPSYPGVEGTDYDTGLGAGGSYGWGRPNAGPAFDATDNKARVVSVGLNHLSSPMTYVISVFAFNCTAVAGKHNWERTNITIPYYLLGGPSPSVLHSIALYSGGIGNTCQIGRKIYFSFLRHYVVTDNSGNVSVEGGTKNVLKKASIVVLDIDNLTSSGVSTIPLPESSPWWIRHFDGPDSDPGANVLTPGQYRSMVAVGTKLIVGPDRFTKIGVDPWLNVYDTATKTWTTFHPPTGNDWPNSLFALTPVPSLGEVWLIGCATGGDSPAAADPVEYAGLHDWRASANGGLYPGRRIVRFKVS